MFSNMGVILVSSYIQRKIINYAFQTQVTKLHPAFISISFCICDPLLLEVISVYLIGRFNRGRFDEDKQIDNRYTRQDLC